MIGAMAALAAALSWGAVAAAADPGRAEALFQQGRRLMNQGRTAEACARFAESHRLDPATGTLLNLAACHEASGRLALAWAEFQEAVDRARADRRRDREAYARERIAAIEPRLGRITIAIDRAASPPDLVVELDGAPVPRDAWGVPIAVDVGPHQLHARRPGRPPWSAAVTLARAGEQLEVNVPLAADHLPRAAAAAAALAPAPVAAAPPAVVPAASTTAAAPTSPAAGGGLRRWGIVAAAGVTVSGLVVGALFGARAFDRWEERKRYCAAEVDACSALAVSAYQDARSYARVSNVAFAVSVVGAAAGAYLIFVRPGEAGVGMAGRW